MRDTYLKISGEDRMRMERIVLDGDSGDALELIKHWLERIAGSERSGMQSHLDAGPSTGTPMK